MVQSVVSQPTLPITFWGYALKTVAHILNLIPTKKLGKTPSKLWNRSHHSLAHVKVWGCDAFVHHEVNDKIETRSEKCYFIGYPHKAFGYLLYKPSKNNVFVSRRRFFLQGYLTSKEASGSQIDLEEIQVKLLSNLPYTNC